MPLEVCGAVVKRELDYWQIDENHIKSCCWRNYRSYIENKRILDSFNRSILKQQMCINVDEGLKGWQRFRTKVWMLLEYPRTSTAAMVRRLFKIRIALFYILIPLTHLCPGPHKRDIGKQCRPRSDAAERGVWSGSTLFVITLESFNNKSNYDSFCTTPLWLYTGTFQS